MRLEITGHCEKMQYHIELDRFRSSDYHSLPNKKSSYSVLLQLPRGLATFRYMHMSICVPLFSELMPHERK